MPETTSTENRAWRNMLDRCYNPRCSAFRQYGWRGIKVCDRWNRKAPRKGCGAAYRNFLKDMGRKPTRFHLLDRIDVNGDYCPENCRWVTPEISRLNMRRTGNKTAARKNHFKVTFLPKDIHFRMKLLAAESGIFLEALVEKAAREFLVHHEQKK